KLIKIFGNICKLSMHTYSPQSQTPSYKHTRAHTHTHTHTHTTTHTHTHTHPHTHTHTHTHTHKYAHTHSHTHSFEQSSCHRLVKGTLSPNVPFCASSPNTKVVLRGTDEVIFSLN